MFDVWILTNIVTKGLGIPTAQHVGRVGCTSVVRVYLIHFVYLNSRTLGMTCKEETPKKCTIHRYNEHHCPAKSLVDYLHVCSDSAGNVGAS